MPNLYKMRRFFLFIITFGALVGLLLPGCKKTVEPKQHISYDPIPTPSPDGPGEAPLDVNIWGYLPTNDQERIWEKTLLDNIKTDIAYGLPKNSPDLSGMVEIPGGKHAVGFQTNGTLPIVSTPTFYIDQYVTSIQQYKKCVAAKQCLPLVGHLNCNPNTAPGNLPALVTFKQAERYCLWLGKRLPTDIEWEKAARGTDGRDYPWGNDTPTDEHANICGLDCQFEWTNKDWDDGYPYINPVDMFHKGDSPYGINQMCGNVKEWVTTKDKMKENHYKNMGSSWYSDVPQLQITNFQNFFAGTRLDDKGVRCVVSQK